MSAEQPKYRVVRKLAQGGMAEVFLGEAVYADGRKRAVAIKRILPALANDPEFVSMLADEAQVGLMLRHPNVVQVHDTGRSRGTPFIVLEYIDGADLAIVIGHRRRIGKAVPIGDAIRIAIEVCRGLTAAHSLRDASGTLLGVVHRDVTPPNILMSRTGEVKLCDFGLVKAKNQKTKTEPGLIKGKFGYLSPEGANGATVDARADIFSLGIILWEMLATQRLFLGDNDYETVKLVQRAEVPSLCSLNPGVDDVLEDVIARALTVDPADRYSTALSFCESLMVYADYAELSDELPGLVADCCIKTASGVRAAPLQTPGRRRSAGPAAVGDAR